MSRTRDIRTAVEDELRFDPQVDATNTGHVRTWAEHDAVVAAAWMANGVSDVRDELAVTG